jgi:glutathione S-transferase
MSLKLYFAPGLCAFASLIALEEAGATYESQRVMLAAGEHRRPEFSRLTRVGKFR